MPSDGVLELTRQSDLQPLVANGVPVFRMYGQIRVELLRALSQQHLALFAEPNPDPTTGDIQWFSPFPGEIRKLADCTEDDRSGVEFHLARLVDDIANHINKLNETGDDASRSMASVLTMAIEIPNESHIFVVDGRPVLAGWGHVPRGPAALQHTLRALSQRVLVIAPGAEAAAEAAAAPVASTAADAIASPAVEQPAVAEPPPPVTTGPVHALVPIVNEVVGPLRAGWLNWLLWPILAALLISIGYLLLRYCGLGWPLTLVAEQTSIVNYCVAPAAPLRTNDLSSHLADLQESLAEKQRRLCALPVVTPSPVVTPVPNELIKERGGRVGTDEGDVNVVLTWHTEDDLDLHVFCPGGEEIYYNAKQKCGGRLDVDSNTASSVKTTSPVENIFWPKLSAPTGLYKVFVDPYRKESTRIDFTVQLLIGGVVVKTENRTATQPGRIPVFEFTLPYAGQRPQ